MSPGACPRIAWHPARDATRYADRRPARRSEPTAPRRPPAGRAGSTGESNRLGLVGEEEAERFLVARGYRIRARRYRIRTGEIDLVAEEAGTLVFVEVKARSSIAYGRPAEAIGSRKRARLIRAARHYLARVREFDRSCRFDVVEVVKEGPNRYRISLIRDAFQVR